MSKSPNKIGADHEFHDAAYVEAWADRFAPTPERLQLFDVVLDELRANGPSTARIIELGLGPGYLAEHVLGAMPEARYVGIDFSKAMLEIAKRRLSSHSSRIDYLRADLVNDEWWSKIRGPVDAVISTWALHDLGSQDAVKSVYQHSGRILGSGGLLLNGDFIKPDKTPHAYEAGRFEVSRHIEMLREVGFNSADCLVLLEEEISSPDASQNYACIRGIR